MRAHARESRQAATPAERLMWAILRNRQLARWKFRRQHVVEQFVLDFYCPRLRLAIELDGAAHFEEAMRAYDETRTQNLRAIGIRVLRFENADLLVNPHIVLRDVVNAIEAIESSR